MKVVHYMVTTRMFLLLQQHKRVSGRLALVDGSNGQSLGRYLNMSRYKETYFSPVLHSTKDGSQYILYGEGGETCKGKIILN